jgi:hypothetical protein
MAGKKTKGLAEGSVELGKPLSSSIGAREVIKGSTSTRRNAASTIERTDKFINIEKGLIPFKHGDAKSSSITVRDAIILCQKAYYNFAIFRNIIDLMSEFSCSGLYFVGGSKKSREFFEALSKKNGLDSFQDKFFREYYRSGNVWIYRQDATLLPADIARMTQTFAEEKLPNTKNTKLPIKYIILNPADIQISGTVSFVAGRYYKVLSDYELEVLRNPKTDEDKEVLESFDPETRDKIINGKATQVLIPLTADKVYAVFYKKQDYEPFAVPMGFPVLDDINWKAEMKKQDMAVSRTMQQAILLVTMGAEPDKGGVNEKHMQEMQTLFENESVGRVLIADYTTKATFVIPQIAEILDPKKYEVVDRDINLGLNNIFLGGEKFANQSMKVQVFVERLKQARKAFLNDFLIPEIKRVAKELGFKNFPTPKFEEIDLKDEVEFARIYTRLVEIGILTADEGIEAITTGRLPTPEENLESQQKFKDAKDKGLYQPIVGGPQDQMKLAEQSGQIQQDLQHQKLSMETGRPPGTTRKQSTKKISPIGGSEAYSLMKVKDNMILSSQLQARVETALKKHFKLKELSEQQHSLAEELTLIIMGNEDPENWLSKVRDYVKNPVDTNPKRVTEITDIACRHQLNTYLATILYASKK